MPSQRISSQAIPTVIAALVALTAPRGATANDFFAGKTISLSTHSDVGGGYDAYLRLLSRHMGKYIPGRPDFIVLNQPGQGGRLAVENAAKAPQDGTFLTWWRRASSPWGSPPGRACRPRLPRSNGSAISTNRTT